MQTRSTAVPQTGLSVHTASLVDVPALVRVWALVQVFQAEHEAALVVVEKKQDAQALQVRSFVALPATAEYPAAQLAQLSQVLRLAAVVKVPLAQARQTRSLVALAGVLMRVPAAQLVSAVQTRSASKLGAVDWY